MANYPTGVAAHRNRTRITFHITRLPIGRNRFRLTFPNPAKLTQRFIDELATLRGNLIDACERPGTDDDLVCRHLSAEDLATLGIRAPNDRTLGESIAIHMDRYDSDTKANTVKSAQRECNASAREFGADRLMSTFEHANTEIERWLRRGDTKARWRKKCGSRFKNLLDAAMRDGIMATHPCVGRNWFDELVPVKRAGDAVAALTGADAAEGVDPFSTDEIAAILAGDTERSDELALAQIGFATGMRTGELFALAAEDIDLKAGMITVQANFTGGKLSTPKSGRTRVVPIYPGIEFILRRQMRKYAGDRVTITDTDQNMGAITRTFLFRNTCQHTNALRETDPLFRGHDVYRKWWVGHLESVGVRVRSPYQMRHTFATVEVNDGTAIEDLAQTMGHRDSRVTRDRYVKHRAEDQQARVARMLANKKAPSALRSVK